MGGLAGPVEVLVEPGEPAPAVLRIIVDDDGGAVGGRAGAGRAGQRLDDPPGSGWACRSWSTRSPVRRQPSWQRADRGCGELVLPGV
jgi:hypothetical protein